MQYIVLSGEGYENTCQSLAEAKKEALRLIAAGAKDVIEIYHCRRLTEITMKVNTISRLI